MEFKASGDAIIVEPLDPPEKIGGLFIAEVKQEEIRQRPIGMVVAFGPRVNPYREEQGDPPLEIGTLVLYDKRGAGVVQGLDTKHYIYLRAPGVYAIVTGDRHGTMAEVKAAQERGDKVNEQLDAAAASSQRRGPKIVAAAGAPRPGPHLSQ